MYTYLFKAVLNKFLIVIVVDFVAVVVKIYQNTITLKMATRNFFHNVLLFNQGSLLILWEFD